MDDAKQAIKKIKNLLKLSDKNFNKLKSKSYLYAKNEFSLNKMGKKYKDVINL